MGEIFRTEAESLAQASYLVRCDKWSRLIGLRVRKKRHASDTGRAVARPVSRANQSICAMARMNSEKSLPLRARMVKRVQTRIHCCLGQRDATRIRSVCENDFIPLNGGNLIIETRHRAAAEKRTRGFWRIKDRGLDFRPQS